MCYIAVVNVVDLGNKSSNAAVDACNVALLLEDKGVQRLTFGSCAVKNTKGVKIIPNFANNFSKRSNR